MRKQCNSIRRRGEKGTSAIKASRTLILSPSPDVSRHAQLPPIKCTYLGIAQRLDVKCLGLIIHQNVEGSGVVVLGKLDLDAQAGQRNLELAIGPAVQRAGRDYVRMFDKFCKCAKGTYILLFEPYLNI